MRLKNISKIYHNSDHTTIKALDNVSLELPDHGLIIILGSSGCGKSTLLNILAGRDREYSGKIEDQIRADMISQDFDLFESLSVVDNLYIVSKDKDKVYHLLEEFKILDQRTKKIKKLSNGQKRRVQIIRALLDGRESLLCDEPTAALDNDMANIVMKKLKDYSKDHLVVVATHDIALAERSADHIIKIENGKIISQNIVNETSSIRRRLPIRKKLLSDHLWFIFTYLRSRLTTIFSITFLVIMLIFTYMTYSLFLTIKSESDEKIAFREYKNLIVSEPYKERQTYEGLDEFVIYDQYTRSQIQSLIDYTDDIIAVQMFTDPNLYLPMNYEGAKIRDISEEEYNVLLEGYFDYINDSFYEDDIYVIVNDERTPFKTPSIPTSLPAYIDESSVKVGLDYVMDNEFEFYDLVSDRDILLYAGKMPSGTDEVLLSYNTAEYLARRMYLTSIDELIGRELRFGIMTNTEETSLDQEAVESKVTVTGISTITFPQGDNTVFFNNGLMNNAFYDSVIKNKDTYKADYVKIMIDPQVDIEDAISEFNSIITPKYSRFIEYSLSYQGTGIAYNSLSSIFGYLSILDLIFLISYIVAKIADRKRYDKEAKILANYGYNVTFVSMIKTILNCFTSICIFLILIHILIPYINELAISYGFTSFMTFDVLGCVFLSTAITLMMLLINGAIER